MRVRKAEPGDTADIFPVAPQLRQYLYSDDEFAAVRRKFRAKCRAAGEPRIKMACRVRLFSPQSDDPFDHVSRIKKMDVERQMVFGEVYAPGIIDTHGETMSAKAIEEMAHRFMTLQITQAIDADHDERSKEVQPIESFIARDGDPDFTPGAWVLGVKINDLALWSRVKTGDINGFSFQGLVRKRTVEAEIETHADNFGITAKNKDHDHLFYVNLDENGKVLHGTTSFDQGHSHEIRKGTATDYANGHRHRYFLE